METQNDYRNRGIKCVGLYFKGRIVPIEKIAKRLQTDKLKGEHLGNRIWLWNNQKTGEAIITGDEGNSWHVILVRSKSREEAIAKLGAKQKKKEIFTEWAQQILEEIPEAT
jgi:hypothetical protein